MAGSLIDYLREAVSLNGELLRISERERAVIIAGKVDELARLVAEGEKVILKLGKVEALIRGEVAAILGPEVNCEQALARAVAALEGEDAAVGQKLVRELSQVLSELEAVNRENAELIKYSLASLSTAVQAVVEACAGSQKVTYSDKGELDDAAQMCLVNRQA